MHMVIEYFIENSWNRGQIRRRFCFYIIKDKDRSSAVNSSDQLSVWINQYISDVGQVPLINVTEDSSNRATALCHIQLFCSILDFSNEQTKCKAEFHRIKELSELKKASQVLCSFKYQLLGSDILIANINNYEYLQLNILYSCKNQTHQRE